MMPLLPNLAGYRLILASMSPRRKALLKDLGLTVIAVSPPHVDESYPGGLSGEETSRYIAEKKAAAYRPLLCQNDLVITADTIVCINGQILRKPVDRGDAINMLRALSGRVHQVYTGVCLSSLCHTKTVVARTDVSFSSLTDDEIGWYVDQYQPYDKAGAYGIQEWIGGVAVEGISGSYFNVMGLPIHLLYKELKHFPALYTGNPAWEPIPDLK